MTMFTRNDKAPETAPRATAGPLDKPETHAPVVVESQNALLPQSTPAPAAAAQGAAGVSVISRALKITGQLESTENIQIDGEIEGDVRGVSVKVGSGAKVKGTVYGDEVELSGTIDGKIEAKKVTLTSSARMMGDVVHQDITVQSGAYLYGMCRPEFGKTEQTETPRKPSSSESVRGDTIAKS